MGATDKLKKAAITTVAFGTSGGLVGTAVAAKIMKDMEKTTYNVSSWGPRKDDPNQAFMMYSPEAALDTSDTITVSGTPFDGKYPVKRGRTRREVWIQPAQPLSESGSGGSFRVKTSVLARQRNIHSAGISATRTTAKKTGDVVKKGANYMWDKIKKALIILVVLMLLYLIITTVIKAKVTQAVTPAPVAPAPVLAA